MAKGHYIFVEPLRPGFPVRILGAPEGMGPATARHWLNGLKAERLTACILTANSRKEAIRKFRKMVNKVE